MPIKRLAASLTMCLVAIAMPAQHAFANAGQVLLQLDIVPNRTLAHPGKDLIYVTYPNGVLAIDTVNHIVAATVEITGSPRGMALSDDGETLFVADSVNPRLIVLDSQLQQSPVFMPTDTAFSSLAMGLNGRLFATKATSGSPWVMYEVNSANGETNQLIFGSGFSINHGGRLAITPDRTQLWWLKIGGSPSRLAAFDVGTEDVSVQWVSPHSGFGSNGQDLALSSNGDRISPCNGAPYMIPAISTANFETIGQFNTGPYPRSAAYSPDDLVLYASHNTHGPLTQWDATDYTLIGTIPFSGTARELSVDRTGRVLIARFNHLSHGTSGLRLIDTGRAVVQSVHFDIRPGSCPNPINLNSKGIVPTAILGSDDFDVSSIDTGTLVLRRADGIGGSVAPLNGPPGPGMTFEDVGTPVGADDGCQCHEAEPDGIIDLALKFRTQDIVAELELHDLLPGQSIELVIEGALIDGMPISGMSCVAVVGRGNAQHVITLLSQWGTCNDLSDCPADMNGDGEVNGLDLVILLSHWN